MKRTITALFLACLLAFSSLFSAVAFADEAHGDDAGMPGDADQVAAVILHTNDVHVAFQDNIGYDGLALYQKELEKVYDHVLLIDAGDAIQGAPIGAISKGAEIIKMMNRLGYDLAVPGNHEFDYGFEALDQCAEDLACGYTCANFCVTGGGTVYQPWRILEAGDLKIGFVGALTPDTFTKSVIKDVLNEAGEPMYDFLADETGDRLCAGLQKAIDEVRQAGADFVILVSHLGSNNSISAQFRSDAVVGRLTGLDLVIDGHAHETFSRTVTDGEGRQIPIAETGVYLKAIGQIKIYKDGRLEQTLIDRVPAPADIPFETVTRHNAERCVDPGMKAFLEEIVASYAPVMERKVGELSYDMIVRDADGFDISRVEENGLCDFVADAFRAVGGTQAALVNAGSVRNNLEAGTVTYNDILSILPYSNDVITVRVTGQMLLDALEFGVSRLPAVSGGFPQVSGISFRVNPGESHVVRDDRGQFVSVDGEYKVSDVMVGGEPLDTKAEYSLAGSSYLLTGGDGYTMFKEADVLSMTGLSDNELLVKYIEEDLSGVIPEDYRAAQGRILMAEAAGAEVETRELTDEELEVALHVIENFVALSQVPRPSGHEEKISTFFKQWAEEQGLHPVQDEVLNVIFDVPATKGYEDWPMVGLQAHMDMVCVGDSPDYDPANDPITVVVDYDNITMTADGTSLGGDDGIGCAIIMSMVQGLAPHGPLRVILTVDEEGLMTGIANLDPGVVADLKYLVNVDSETSDAVTVSTAGGIDIDIDCDEVDVKAPDGDLAVTVAVSGLAGGHSGVDIDKGRQNAIYVLDTVLEGIVDAGVPFEIASMEGGQASNAIPDSADALLVIRSEDFERLSAAVAEQEAECKARAAADPGLTITAAKADGMPEAVIAPEFAERVHALLGGLVSGIYSMSEDIEGLVESSSNMGVFSLSPKGLTSYSYMRSSSTEKQDEILAIDGKVIAENGLTAEYVWGGDAWPYKPDSVLVPLTQEVYREQNGSEIRVEAVHATLECGTFAKMNPELDMVSIGPDLINVHSTSEMLYLLTIPKTFNLLAGILDGVAAAAARNADEALPAAA